MLTRSGLGALIAAVVLASFGLWWHYEELLVFGAILAAVVAVAVWSARSVHRTKITRGVFAPRVARGDPVRLVYRAVNTGRRRTPPAVIVDTCDDIVATVELPSIPPDDRTEVVGSIPTRRRGVFSIGPWSIQRLDPLGLAIGRRTSDSLSSIIVHPRIHALQGPYGAMHTVEDEAVIRRSASDPLSGFVSLREYVQGDDPRLIHWPTSARMGTLMLREHVELRRPEFTVVLDAADHVATADDFEEMVDVAASVAVHALESGVNVSLRTTARAHPGALRPIDRETLILDLLTPVRQSPHDQTMSLAEIFRAGIDHTMIVVVTGPDGPSTLLSHTEKTSVIRIGDGAVTGPGVALAVADAAEFASRWKPWR